MVSFILIKNSKQLNDSVL